MTPIQATLPLQFVTMDYLTIEKAMGYENIERSLRYHSNQCLHEQPVNPTREPTDQ